MSPPFANIVRGLIKNTYFNYQFLANESITLIKSNLQYTYEHINTTIMKIYISC